MTLSFLDEIQTKETRGDTTGLTVTPGGGVAVSDM